LLDYSCCREIEKQYLILCTEMSVFEILSRNSWNEKLTDKNIRYIEYKRN